MKLFRLLYIVGFVLFLLSFKMYPVKSEESKKKNAIIIATWNIGYFSNGVSSLSYIKSTDYDSKLKEYRSLIYDSIQSDIITVNEYNRVFIGKDDENNKNVTSSILFNQYAHKVIGPRKGFRKALFSKLTLKNKRLKYFSCHKFFEKDEDIKNTTSYYIESTVYINGEEVKIVNVHLMFSRKIPIVVQKMQIEELINTYDKDKRVVILGDFNLADYSQFKKAGYIYANDGSLVTHPQSKKGSLDNIVAKGLTISDVRVIKTELSDHYPIMCKISIEKGTNN